MRVIFDMETGDPDDFLTLCLLAGHPRADLVGVTVTPGTPHQVGIVKWVLDSLDLSIPVGAYNMDHRKNGKYSSCVSLWHYNTYGKIAPSQEAEEGWRMLDRIFTDDTTLVTGGPLKNLGRLLEESKAKRGRLFIQGGFAGDNIVPPEHRLPKFEGKITCPTYNLNGDVHSALATFNSECFQQTYLISKNVCHGVVYDQTLHQWLLSQKTQGRQKASLELLTRGMGAYLKKKTSGKKFHDPLAAMCAINPQIGTWAEVEPYREKGAWGCHPRPGSGISIITHYDHDLFKTTLIGRH